MKFTHEERIDVELAWRHVKAHITHLQQPMGYYSVVTVASPKHEKYRDLDIGLAKMYLEGHVKKRSDFGTLIIDRFTEMGCGVALCHHLDNFSRKRGRIIAKGRLLKLLKEASK